MAMGVVMERYHLSSEQAFEILCRLSQESHRKVNRIAEDIVFSGELPHAGSG